LPSHPHSARHHLHPHSFPTRRSSDLVHLADLNIGYLYVAAVSSIAVYGVALGGWSSNSKYALLGGLRSSAQLISYELAQGLAALGVIAAAGSLSLVRIVNAQFPVPFAIVQPLGLAAHLVA